MRTGFKVFLSSSVAIIAAVILIYLNPTSVITLQIKGITPTWTKQVFREAFFFRPDARNKIFSLEKKTKDYEVIIRRLSESLSQQMIKTAVQKNESIQLNKTSISLEHGLKLSTYPLPLVNYLYNDKAVGYIDQNENNLFIISGTGHSFYVDKEDLGNEYLSLNIVKNNLNQIIDDMFFFDTQKKTHQDSNVISVKDILITKDELLLSYTKELTLGCYNTSIIHSKISIKELVFNDLFIPKTCVSPSMLEDIIMSGGRMEPYLNNSILFTVGDYRQWSEAQNIDSILGKILELNIQTLDYKVFSLGHRNPQGLMVDNETLNIFSSEHGPVGGDEINIIKKDSNYGWPIASYGDMYADMGYTKEEKLKAPMLKSHKKYSLHESNGFEEPLFTASRYRNDYKKLFNIGFDQENGLSEIERIPNTSSFSILGDLLVTSMQQRTMYFFRLSTDQQKIISATKIPFPDRVRDIIYVQEKDVFALILEKDALLGILELEL